MTREIIKNLIDQLSCDFVLSDPEEPESLSVLLPMLKQIHGKCIELSLHDNAREVLKARTVIDSFFKKDSKDVDEKMNYLRGFISELSSSVHHLKEPEETPEPAVEKIMDSVSDGACLDQIETILVSFSRLIGGFCPGVISDLGAMLNIFDELIEASKEEKFNIFHEISIACKGYVEKMTLENIDNIKPIEEGLLLLKSILRHLKKNEIFAFDYSDVLELLEANFEEEQIKSKTSASEAEETDSEPSVDSQIISDDDMEILIDFISEAEENLDTIEVNLIDLEQDPTNSDIINNIFRPFHTIKGVSGFLSLNKINKLSHTTENLLDAARSGDFIINDIATDAILDSVDTLKNLLAIVKKGTETGILQSDDSIDVEGSEISATRFPTFTELSAT